MAGKLQLDFQGKRVIVAGGSRGIGRSIALAFAAAGAARFDMRPRRRDARQDKGGTRPVSVATPMPRHAISRTAPKCQRYIERSGRGARRHRCPGKQRLRLRHDG